MEDKQKRETYWIISWSLMMRFPHFKDDIQAILAEKHLFV